MNAYARRSDLKARVQLDASRTAALDDVLLDLIEAASRRIESPDICNRVFYPRAAQTRYFSALATGAADLYIDDFVSITSVQVDSNEDGTYDYTLVEDVDFWAHRLDGDSGKPIVRLEIVPWGSQVDAWPTGRRGVKIVGSTGWAQTTESVLAGGTAVTGTLADTTTTTLTLSLAGHGIDPGETLLIESEQVYVDATPDELTARVTRAVNGTTAAAHTTKSILRLTYPALVVSEVIRLAEQMAWASQAGSVGSFQSESGFNADAPFRSSDMFTSLRKKLSGYRRQGDLVV
jgi:hypothetical protein